MSRALPILGKGFLILVAVRRVPVWLVPIAITVLTSGCTEGSEPASEVGAIAVTVTTSGGGTDPDGYTVSVDGVEQGTITPNGSLVASEISSGARTVALGGLAQICRNVSASQEVEVPAGDTASLSFEVTCTPSEPPVHIDTYPWSVVATLERVDSTKCVMNGTAGADQGVRPVGSYRVSVFCYDSPFPHPDINGTFDLSVDGRAVAFTHAFCNWTGTAFGTPPDRVAGSVTCAVPQFGNEPAVLDGTWLWQKPGPLSRTPDLTGDWVMVATMVGDSLVDADCRADGEVNLVQTGTTLNGQISNSHADCGASLAPPAIDQALTGAVNFTDHRSAGATGETCRLLGVIGGNPPIAVTGDISCTVQVVGTDSTVQATGTFRLFRTVVP